MPFAKNSSTSNPGSGWTEGFPIEYQEFDGDLTNPDHPATTIAYWRVYWRYVQPAPDSIDWGQFDKVLATAASRGQTVLLRIAPYGTPGRGESRDVPEWYRQMVGPEKKLPHNWRVDPNDPLTYPEDGAVFEGVGFGARSPGSRCRFQRL